MIRTPIDFMLARDWTGQDPTGMAMSEKYDGVRAMWTGGNLVTRGGNKINAPAWWLAKLPAGVVLDGELWAGRGKFQMVKGAVRRKAPRDADWREIKLMVFDCPLVAAAFSRRYYYIKTTLIENDVLKIVEQQVCFEMNDLYRAFLGVVENGGEGLMLRVPSAGYEPWRSGALQKVKPGKPAVEQFFNNRMAA